jgi:Na+/H+ antiporter NhaD/arsenite permease-like protein
MAAIMVLVLVVGTALDLAPTILILTPVLMPIIKEAGIDPVYFGIIFVMNNCIGLITPPVGIVLNVVSGVARVPLGQVIVGVMPFLLAQVAVLFLLVLLSSTRYGAARLAQMSGAGCEAQRKQQNGGRPMTSNLLKGLALALCATVFAGPGIGTDRGPEHPRFQRRQ